MNTINMNKISQKALNIGLLLFVVLMTGLVLSTASASSGPGEQWDRIVTATDTVDFTSAGHGVFGPPDGSTTLGQIIFFSSQVTISGTPGTKIYVYEASGNVAPGWPVFLPGVTSKNAIHLSLGITTVGTIKVPILVAYKDSEPGENAKIFIFDRYGQPFGAGVIDNGAYSTESVTMVDVDGDGLDDIVVNGSNGLNDSNVRAYSIAGTLLMDIPLTLYYSGMRLTVADIDNDGTKDLVGFGGTGLLSQDNIFWIDLSPLHNVSYRNISRRINDLTVADIDKDGTNEIVAMDRNLALCCTSSNIVGLSVYRSDGSVIWYHSFFGTGVADIYNAPVVANIDGDAELEVVAYYRDQDPVTSHHRTSMSVFNHDGSLVPGWPVHTLPHHAHLQTQNAQSAFVAELDGDPEAELIMVGANRGRPMDLIAYNHDGTVVGGWPAIVDIADNVAILVGDIDGNNGMNIMVIYNKTLPPTAPPEVHIKNFEVMDSGSVQWGQAFHDSQRCKAPGVTFKGMFQGIRPGSCL